MGPKSGGPVDGGRGGRPGGTAARPRPAPPRAAPDEVRELKFAISAAGFVSFVRADGVFVWGGGGGSFFSSIDAWWHTGLGFRTIVH